MGISVIVFEEGFAPITGDLIAWYRDQRNAESDGNWQRPETSSSILNAWFSEMKERFPLLIDADPDNPHGTDYSFYKHFVYMDMASSVGEDGILTAWQLAELHGLRVLVSGELLPRHAQLGERKVHITALDGRKVRAQSTGGLNVSMIVLDSVFVPISNTKQWVREQFDVEVGGDDFSIASGSLKSWNDEFRKLSVSFDCIEIRFFSKLTLLRVRPKDLNVVAPVAIKLAKKYCLGLSIFEDLLN